jgi:hypothetical protein
LFELLVFYELQAEPSAEEQPASLKKATAAAAERAAGEEVGSTGRPLASVQRFLLAHRQRR